MQEFDRDPRTLVAAFAQTSAYADDEAILYGDERYTYRQQYQLAYRLAYQLVHRFGVRPGDRVAFAMRNYPEFPLVFWATQLAGAIAVPLNAWLSSHELAVLVDDCEPAVIFADDERLQRLSSHPHLLAKARGVVAVRCQHPGTNAFSDLVADDSNSAEFLAHQPEPDDVATILYTSGTTGRPKGVLGTHRNHVSTILSVRLRAEALRESRDGTDTDGGGAPQGTTLITFPLFHIAGLTIMTSNTFAGRRVALMYKWDVEDAMRIIAAEQVSELTGPPLVVRQTIEAARTGNYDVSSLTTLGNGGAPAGHKQVRDIVEVFDGRVVPTTGYGLTETTSAVLLNTGAEFVDRPSGIGRLLPTVEIHICDGQGQPVDPGAVGELWVRGPQVAAGYYRLESATEAAFGDGWFRTGDLVIQSADGFVELVGRLKDVIIRGGENVYCAEVESVLEDHPDVIEAAIVGRPHELLGEEVEAVVRLHSGRDIGGDQLIEFAAARLATFKVPRHVTISPEPLPRNAAGKLMKRELISATALKPTPSNYQPTPCSTPAEAQ
ncbi:class I adenylate-forming enzyme family protein [Rhodococcus opacus]|nr:class I adenylate-forming enzyme family protein [Rhodococcus opacus]